MSQPSPPLSNCSSVPDLSSTDAFNPIKVRKRRQHELDAGSGEGFLTEKSLEIYFNKWQQVMMDNVTQTIVTSVNSVLTEKLTQFSSDLETIRKDFKKVSNKCNANTESILEIKQQIPGIESSINFSNNRQDHFDERLLTIEEQSKTIQRCETELRELNIKYNSLRSEFKLRQQWDRLYNLEIVGVPENHDEVLITTVIAIAKHAGVTITSRDIEFANRVQAKQTKLGVPRAIIVKMKSRLAKDNIIAGIRRVRGITRSNIGMQGGEKIFVNEHLTIENKILYNKTRELVVANSFKYIWIRNCKIFVRRDDKSPKIVINKEEDLVKIK